MTWRDAFSQQELAEIDGAAPGTVLARLRRLLDEAERAARTAVSASNKDMRRVDGRVAKFGNNVAILDE